MSKIKSRIDLEIIILNYNSCYWLEKTLSTLKKHYLDQTKYQIKVTVVDNASSDNSIHVIKKRYSWTNLIQLDQNKGFAAGNNVALAKTQARMIMLLNSDIEFLPKKSNLDPLIEYLDTHSQTAVITPKLQLNTGKIDFACHRGEPTLWASLTYFLKLEKNFPTIKLLTQYHQLYKGFDSIHTIDACSGAAMIVKTDAMKKVGLLDEQFFMYAEDLDWCRRFREHGYTITYYPKTSLIHHKNKSGIQANEKQLAQKTSHHFYDTMLQYYDKHYARQYPKVVRWFIHKIILSKKEHYDSNKTSI